MLKNLPLIFCFAFFLFSEAGHSQVEKTVVVEHFTNSRCIICANRNPGFFENLEAHPKVIHLAVHPSSPYSNCELNLNNPAENDGRTNYYGIYGSTPKLVVQGDLVSVSEDYGDPEIFEPYLDQTSPASIEIIQYKNEGTIDVSVTVTRESDEDLGNLRLFAAIAEDVVFYEAPNGEDEHYNVMRKSLTPTEGTAMALPETVGESVSFTFSFAETSQYIFERLFAVVILQEEEGQSVVQSASVSPNFSQELPSSVDGLPELQNVQIAPNPASDFIQVSLPGNLETMAQLTDVSGRLISVFNFQTTTRINPETLNAGLYFLTLENEEGYAVRKISVK